MEKLESGVKAPEFSLKDQHGNEVSLKDFKGRKILIYFYPKANTPGCTTQSCAVEESRPEFEALSTAVIGISPDAVEKQKKFADKFDLKFPLISDEDHKTAAAYGVWGEKKLYGKVYMGITRSSFLIDEDGVVVKSWYKVSPKDTVPFAMEILKD